MKNPIRCGKVLITKEVTLLLTNDVKRFLLNGQSASEGLDSKEKNLRHAYHRWQLPSLQRLNIGHPDGFLNWFIGLIEGDGLFYFNKTGAERPTWVFSLKISQSNYNLKLLAYIKKKLKCGSVKPSGINSSQFYLRNPLLLHFFLLSILPDNPFLTRAKAWQFLCFKKALDIYVRAQTTGIPSRQERDVLLDQIKEQSRSIPSTFKITHPQNDYSYPNLGWLIGFTEAEGSFFLDLKKKNLLVHAVSWVQKDEKELLEAIGYKLGIKAKVFECQKEDFRLYKLVTDSASTILNIIPLFEGKMKGMKAVEVRKWARSFRKARGNFKVLSKLQYTLRQAKKHCS
uniref:hypothetical protein n=1 Tax=Gormaniella terricola TaxID=2904618 RepID=UPI0021CC6AD8|nr:hypothetical protein ODF01_mgp02 [Gormaniella terricola]UWV18326.1 hypothetical protein [Gormaniella terricola]